MSNMLIFNAYSKLFLIGTLPMIALIFGHAYIGGYMLSEEMLRAMNVLYIGDAISVIYMAVSHIKKANK